MIKFFCCLLLSGINLLVLCGCDSHSGRTLELRNDLTINLYEIDTIRFHSLIRSIVETSGNKADTAMQNKLLSILKESPGYQGEGSIQEISPYFLILPKDTAAFRSIISGKQAKETGGAAISILYGLEGQNNLSGQNRYLPIYSIRTDKSTNFDRSDIKKIETWKQPETEHTGILVSLHPEAAGDFAKITESSRGSQIAMVINGKVIYAPKVHESITGGMFTITGEPAETKTLIASIEKSAPEQ